MKKIAWILILLIPIISFAQNNAIFFGGNADGISTTNYLQANTSISHGGVGDGSSVNVNALSYLPITKGGSGDGISNTHYDQLQPLSNSIGGNGDGLSNINYNQVYVLHNTIGGIGDGYSNIELPLSPLPISLLSFTGVGIQEGNLLDWEVLGLSVDDSCILERSKDANHFQRINEQVVEDAESTQYQYLDKDFIIGDNYYRLEIVKLNGERAYSNIVLIRNTDNLKMSAYPNPFNDKVNIRIESASSLSDIKINMYNVLGQEISNISVHKNDNIYSISTASLPAGSYTIIVNNGNDTQYFKVVKVE